MLVVINMDQSSPKKCLHIGWLRSSISYWFQFMSVMLPKKFSPSLCLLKVSNTSSSGRTQLVILPFYKESTAVHVITSPHTAFSHFPCWISLTKLWKTIYESSTEEDSDFHWSQETSAQDLNYSSVTVFHPYIVMTCCLALLIGMAGVLTAPPALPQFSWVIVPGWSVLVSSVTYIPETGGWRC